MGVGGTWHRDVGERGGGVGVFPGVTHPRVMLQHVVLVIQGVRGIEPGRGSPSGGGGDVISPKDVEQSE